jgi:hypothetical protein
MGFLSGLFGILYDRGFGMVESGFARSINCVTFYPKNLCFCRIIAGFTFRLGLMFACNGFIGERPPYGSGADNSPRWERPLRRLSSISWSGVPSGLCFSSSCILRTAASLFRDLWLKESNTYPLSYFIYFTFSFINHRSRIGAAFFARLGCLTSRRHRSSFGCGMGRSRRVLVTGA